MQQPAKPVPDAPHGLIRTWIGALGPLRLFLAVIALILIVFATAPGTRPVYHGFALWPTLLMPVFAPVILTTLLLDALMARVFMVEKDAMVRARYRRAVTVNLVLAAALVLTWLPYFRALAE
jgi:hypothetical protein